MDRGKLDEIVKKAKMTEADRVAKGIALAGGLWHSKSYATLYRGAAERLHGLATSADDLDALALPIGFLERHAVELLVKDLIDWCADIRDSERLIEKKDTGACTQSALQTAAAIHELSRLRDSLYASLAALGFDTPLAALDEVVELVDRVEQSEVARFRFPTVGKTKSRAKSFPEETEIPLAELRRKVTALFEALYSESGLSGDLYYWSSYLDGELYRRGLL